MTSHRTKAEIYSSTFLEMKNKHLFVFEAEAEIHEEESGAETNSSESKCH